MNASTSCSTTRDSVLARLMEDYLASCEAGQPLTADELAGRYPELADDVVTCLASLNFIRQAAANESLPGSRHGAEVAIAQLDGYELLEEIGRGGMGVVYRARQKKLNRPVALKMIRAGHLATAAQIERFTAEAEAAASLDHPRIVPIHEVGHCAGQHYFSMKLIEGGSLAESRGREPGIDMGQQRQVARLIATIADAVHYAHQRGILHRDLKPSNILLDGAGQPYVTDFGLAKRFEGGESLTGTGDIVGTPLYMAPEQAAGSKHLTTAADIYSLGAILYWLLTGKPAFQAATPLETLRQVQEQEPPRPRSLNPSIDRDLETICLKCLEKDPQRRYSSAAALADDLVRWLAGEPILARPLTRPERLFRWAKRQPAIAGLSIAILFVAFLGLFGVINQWQAAIASEQKAVANEQKAVSAAAAAQEKEQDATRQRDEVAGLNKKLLATQEKLQRMLYASDLNQAKLALDAGAVYRAGELLDKHRPKAGERDQRGFEWHYLARLCHPDLFTLRGHKREVYCVAYSPDGKKLASGSDDETIKVWDAETGRELLTLRGHTGWVHALVFSPDGQRIASTGKKFDTQENEVPAEYIVWDTETGKQLLQWTDARRGDAIAFSPDGKRIASSSGRDVKLRDSATGAELKTINALSSLVHTVVFSPDGRRLACVGGDYPDGLNTPPPGEIKIFDAQTGAELSQLKGHTGIVFRAAFSPDGKRLASASLDKTARVWDAESGQALLTLTGHASNVYGVAFSPNGKRLATSSSDRSLRLWDAVSGRELATFKGQTVEYVNVVFSPDGKNLVTSGSWGAVMILDPEVGEARVIQNEHADHPIAYSPDGKRLATASGDTAITLDVESGSEVLRIDHPQLRESESNWRGIYLLAYSHDGKFIAIRGSRGLDKDSKDLGAELKVWDAHTGQLVREFGDDSPRGAGCLAFSPDSKQLGISGKVRGDHLVRIWDLKSGSRVRDFKWDNGPAPALENDQRRLIFAFSPDGRRIASTMPGPSRLVIWNAETGDEALKVESPKFFGAHAIAFSPDGDRLACALGNIVRILDARTGAELLLLTAHTDWINNLAFSPDGQRLATGLSGETVTIWDTVGGQELLNFAARNAALAFSPDGHHLAISSYGAVRILDATPVPPRPNGIPPIPPPSDLQGRQIAEGWRVWSREPEGFEIGLDSEIRHGGTKSAFIKSKREGSYSIGAGAMQTFAADAYRGKRIRLSAYLKADQVIGKAGLWMRCDSQTKIVAFDNMRDRKITGTSDWQKYEIVLDVPEESVSISFGFTLGSGTGQIWADDFQLEVVGLDVPITDMSIGDPFTGKNVPPEQPKPLNLDFEK